MDENYQPYVDACAALEVAKATYGVNSDEVQVEIDLVIAQVNAGYVAAGLPDPKF